MKSMQHYNIVLISSLLKIWRIKETCHWPNEHTYGINKIELIFTYKIYKCYLTHGGNFNLNVNGSRRICMNV